jgi:hypothetical protein
MWRALLPFAQLLRRSNPNRLYHWESTARGFENLFYDQWDEAKKATSQKTIFVSWWANEMYRISRDDPGYEAYYGPRGETRTALNRVESRGQAALRGGYR